MSKYKAPTQEDVKKLTPQERIDALSSRPFSNISTVKFKSKAEELVYARAFKKYLLKREVNDISNALFYVMEATTVFACSMNVHSQRDQNTLKSMAAPIKELRRKLKQAEAKLKRFK